MNLLTERIRPMYFRYLAAAFGSALISSVYAAVDTAMVGQYQGPDGAAAMAVVAPLWNIVYSLGLLTGIGGSVLFGTLRGRSERNRGRANEFFTAAVIGTGILALVMWIAVAFFDRQLLFAFGSNEELMPLARSYVFPLKFVIPSFLFTQLFSAFLRNDGNPELATKAVMVSGVFNIAGDYFCVFVLDMGIMGAGLATGVSSVLSLLVMLTHFRSKRCTIHFAKPRGLARMLKDIAVTGFATFFTDVAMGILTILFNHQVLKYLGSEALSIYGVIINVSTFVQCCAYSVGQASQPIISANFGAGRGGRIRQVLNYASVTALLFGLFWVLLSLFAPNLYVRIFMSPTESILAAAPTVIRVYGISFLLLPFNIFSTYYFQALIQPRTSFVVSVARGAVLSGILIYLLPALFAPAALWFAMPVTELVVAIYAAVRMMQFTNRLPDITA